MLEWSFADDPGCWDRVRSTGRHLVIRHMESINICKCNDILELPLGP